MRIEYSGAKFKNSTFNYVDGPLTQIICGEPGVEDIETVRRLLDSKNAVKQENKTAVNGQKDQIRMILIEKGKRVGIDVIFEGGKTISKWIGYEGGEITNYQIKAKPGQTVMLACLLQSGTRYIETISENKTIHQAFVLENNTFKVKYGSSIEHTVTSQFEAVNFVYDNRDIEIYGRSAVEEKLFGDILSSADIPLNKTLHTSNFSLNLLKHFVGIYHLQNIFTLPN